MDENGRGDVMEFTPEQVEWLQDVQRLRLRPGDYVVVKAKRVLSNQQYALLQEAFRRNFPDNEVIVLDESIELIGVLGKEVADAVE